MKRAYPRDELCGCAACCKARPGRRAKVRAGRRAVRAAVNRVMSREGLWR
jgi:hypothetical protein